MRKIRTPRSIKWCHSTFGPISFWIVVLLILFWPVWMDAFNNYEGPSTSYFNQIVASAVPGPDGVGRLYIGDPVVITAATIRHKPNGDCRLNVNRVRENIGGPDDGNIHLMQHVDQAFVGEGFYRETTWPIAPAKITVDDSWFDDRNAKEQAMDMFVVGRYDCNLLDPIIPRFLHNNAGPTTPALLSRKRTLVGFTIPGWDAHSGLEGPHSRVIVERRRRPFDIPIRR